LPSAHTASASGAASVDSEPPTMTVIATNDRK
jgi:hypothetical protein